MLTPSDLLALPDFALGTLTVSPARRTVVGEAGERSLEPRFMQVLVLLARHRGEVVSRDMLLEQVWGVPVGDDSLNRAIAGVRKALAPDPAVRLETITRTGYRLSVEGDEAAETPPGTDRRTAIAGIGTAAVLALGGGAWWTLERRRANRAADLVGRADRILRDGRIEQVAEARSLLERAVADETRDPKAWGLLAYACRDLAEMAPPGEVTAMVERASMAARRALALDAAEPHARVALATLHPDFSHWVEVEDQLRAVLADDADQFYALNALSLLLQAVGRSSDSHAMRMRTFAMEPGSPAVNFKAALASWVTGDTREADRILDRALVTWPLHTGVWHARLLVFAFTGRTGAVLSMLDDTSSRPASAGPPVDQFWRPFMKALDSRAAADRIEARDTMLAFAGGSPSAATHAIMGLAMLDEIDAAYAVCDGLLLRRGPTVSSLWEQPEGPQINAQFWRRTMNLFTPPSRVLHRDPRWGELCEGIGLADYWRTRGIGPDARA
ncbi:winged helix-turn-helix domain-containing protein [Sphingomicrobium nitratireducens]|uniref:winged helix-turn-helix domain-containing protein n=1 Tax=Sphingomicrobium nitratireducens TaxID=2964666 RepID=UPI00223F9B5E|nr:winged helix-turn-helix domain-containing protein [Sphingomicrobium nitratireducens]